MNWAGMDWLDYFAVAFIVACALGIVRNILKR